VEWLSNLWDWIMGNHSDDPAGSSATPCDAALSMEQAQSLHDQMAAQSEIPFNYAPDCCYARAQRMSRLMAAQGISNNRAWFYAPRRSALAPVDADGDPVTLAGQPILWSYHVAPTVLVRGRDGVCRDMVIDPSLRDHPMTVEQWEAIMGGQGTRASSGPDVFYRSPSGRETAAPEPSAVDAVFARHRESLAQARGR